MSDRYTNAEANQIKDRSLKQIELDITNTPSDGQILKVNMPTGDFTAIDAPSVVALAATVAVNQTNIVLNAFRIAIDASRSIFNMVDGIVDYFNDETGIDTANSTNEEYDAANDLYSPTSAGGLTTSPYAHYKCNDDAANTTVTDDGTGANNGVGNVNTSNYSVAGKINDAFELNGTSECITVDALVTDIISNTTGSFSLWVKADTGETSGRLFAIGDADGDSAFSLYWESSRFKANIFITGSNHWFAQGAASGSPVTEWHFLVLTHDGVTPRIYTDGVEETNFTISSDKTKYLVDFSGGDLGRIGCQNTNGSGNVAFFDGQIDDFRYYQNKVLTQSEIDSLYNSGSGTEVDQPVGTTDNMTLISDTFTAEAEPDDARIVVLLEDVDAVTINTDLIAKISRDGGANYSTVTLSDDGNFDASKRILTGSVDISGQPSGTSMEYKLETANAKDLKIHSAALNWE